MTNTCRQQQLVSVIIPTYNRAGIIGETIENIFQQTYLNIEVIVVDDGSTDDTASVLRSFGSRIRWIARENAGPAAARNRGLAMAKGEIIAFQDSDDAWHPTKIERQVSLLERAGSSVPCCLCNVAFHSENGRGMTSFDNAPITPPYEEGLWMNVAEVLTTRFILFNQASAIRRSVVEKLGGFDERLKYLEDYEFSLRLAVEGPWAFIRTPLVNYRQDSVNSLARKALDEPILTSECDVILRNGILQRFSERGGDPKLRTLMESYLKRAQRVLRHTKMKKSSSRGAQFLGNCYLQVERFRSAIDRRLSSYPQMKVRPITDSPAAEILASKFGERTALALRHLDDAEREA